MGDAGEGLIDAESRIQERMDQLELERSQTRGRPVRDPERMRMLESLRLARTELEQQLSVTTHERRRGSIQEAIDEVNRRLAEAARNKVGRSRRSTCSRRCVGHRSRATSCSIGICSGWATPRSISASPARWTGSARRWPAPSPERPRRCVCGCW